MIDKQSLTYEAIPLPARPALSDEAQRAAAQAFHETMASRHTVRDFSTRPVPREVIETCIRTAGTAPSGANHQPWHFVAVSNPEIKRAIRHAAEQEEARFYDGAAGDDWLKALEPIGTGPVKPHVEDAPWLIVVFAQRYGQFSDGTRFKNYYVPESTGIAVGFLIAALHHAGLACLPHTPNPMKFLTQTLGRPDSEKPLMILACGFPTEGATIPKAATLKKPLSEILTIKD